MLLNHFSDSKLRKYDADTLLDIYWELKNDYFNRTKDNDLIIINAYSRVVYELHRRLFSQLK